MLSLPEDKITSPKLLLHLVVDSISSHMILLINCFVCLSLMSEEIYRGTFSFCYSYIHKSIFIGRMYTHINTLTICLTDRTVHIFTIHLYTCTYLHVLKFFLLKLLSISDHNSSLILGPGEVVVLSN